MNDKLQIRNSTAEFLIFAIQNESDTIEVRFEENTLWLTQLTMAELFQTTKQNISQHIQTICDTGELTYEATVKDFLTVRKEGTREVRRTIEYYSLDMIIAVGYRVNSRRATQFRQWATKVLRDFALRGYVLDRKRMENGRFLGEDYFEHLLAEIREIRLSERLAVRPPPCHGVRRAPQSRVAAKGTQPWVKCAKRTQPTENTTLTLEPR